MWSNDERTESTHILTKCSQCVILKFAWINAFFQLRYICGRKILEVPLSVASLITMELVICRTNTKENYTLMNQMWAWITTWRMPDPWSFFKEGINPRGVVVLQRIQQRSISDSGEAWQLEESLCAIFCCCFEGVSSTQTLKTVSQKWLSILVLNVIHHKWLSYFLYGMMNVFS